MKVNLNSNKTVLQSIYLIFLFFYYVDPSSPRARVSLLASHDHLRAKRRCLAITNVQAIKSRFFPAIQSTGNTDHSLFSSLPLYYWGSSKVPSRAWAKKACGGNRLLRIHLNNIQSLTLGTNSNKVVKLEMPLKEVENNAYLAWR